MKYHESGLEEVRNGVAKEAAFADGHASPRFDPVDPVFEEAVVAVVAGEVAAAATAEVSNVVAALLVVGDVVYGAAVVVG